MYVVDTIPICDNQKYYKCDNESLHGTVLYWESNWVSCQLQGCGKALKLVKVTKLQDGTIREESIS